MSEGDSASARLSGTWLSEFSIKGYELVEPLGDGARGRMVKARHAGLKRFVAMKLLAADAPSDEVERFRKSVKACASIHHPNIVSVLDAGTCVESGIHYVAMEFLEGPSLESYLQEQGKLAEQEAVAVCQSVCEALVALEESGLTHGDLRPANVLLDEDWTPKLAEVGLAKPFCEDPSVARARCAAPELFEEQPPSTRSDLYGLGILLYRALTGHYPFESESVEGLKLKHQSSEVPSPSDEGSSEEVSRVLSGLCARNSTRRYETAQQANLDLVRVMSGHPPEGLDSVGSDTESFRLDNLDGDTPSALPRVLSEAPPAQAVFEFLVRLSSRGVTLAEFTFDKDVVIIGRGGASDVHVDNPIVSRTHAEIRRVKGRLFIKARSATNITTLNGKSIKGEEVLKLGDLIVISDKFHLEVSWDSSARPSAPVLSCDEDDDTPVVGTPRESIPQHLPPPLEPRAAPKEEEPSPHAQPVSEATPSPSAESNPYADPNPCGEEAAYGGHMDLDTPSAADNPYGPPTEQVVRRRVDATVPSPRPGESDLTRIDSPPQGYVVYSRRGRSVRSFVDKGFQVGRSSSCDLRLGRDDPRKAALIVRGIDAYRLYNVAPEIEMVTLNGESVPDRAVLEDGDEIVVCGMKIIFSSGE